MFGRNAIAPVIADPAALLWVQEIFPTIQGEGPSAGTPAIFVRLAGCNLRCSFCDTDFESSTLRLSRDALLHCIDELETKIAADLIVFTGGEPLRQAAIVPVMRKLLDLGYDVQIETAGTVWPEGMDALMSHEGMSVICSPKTGKVHPKIIKFAAAFKYIVAADDASPKDGLPIQSTQTPDHAQPVYRARHSLIWVQPRAEYDARGNPDDIATFRNVSHAAKIAMHYGYRLSLQIHKLIGLP